MNDARLVQFKRREGFQEPTDYLAPVHKKPRNYLDECAHKYVDIDENDRAVECRACHKPVDPFQFLLTWAHEDAMIDYRLAKIADFEAKDRAKDAARMERLRKRMEKNGTEFRIG